MPPQAVPPRTEDAAIAERRDTIRYGIDSQIMTLLKELASEKEDAFNDDLLELYMASRSPRLRSSVLDFLGGREWTGAEAEALGIIEDRDLNDQALVAAALSYLASIRSKGALAFAQEIAEEDDAKLLPSLVRLLGRAGGPDEERLLLSWLDDDGASESTKLEAVRALGDMKSTLAADRLALAAADADAGKALRMYACEALAKIGDPISVSALVTAANGGDPNVRTSAIEALAAFPSAEAEAAIIEGLRDSYANARLAATKAAGKRKATSALPFLRYKAANDPEKSVRLEACRAIAAIGGDSFVFLRERLEDAKEDRTL
ncbi:MAG: HEAT repeat domain-containing protein, partial [Spirochaetaceae bacterium]|nr:HEAT repeat domain-containing protein [Spirochaetaceae bacterium]